MSNSSTTNDPTLLPSNASEASKLLSRRSLVDRYHGNPLTTPLEIAGFWSAILLPLCYVPMLLADVAPTVLFAVLAVNVVALLFGHTHRRD